MKLLSQNAKMKKPNKINADLYNFGIPAFISQDGTKTCPNAGVCAAGCYARSGTYGFSNVKSAYESRFELTKGDGFIAAMISEVESKLKLSKKRGKDLVLIRIHDSGDFYSLAYFLRWTKIMSHFESRDDVRFYAYTKQVKMFQGVDVPANFNLIFSEGGKQDALIDRSRMKHARVFETLSQLEAAGYIDGTKDDTIAAVGSQIKIGLVYHGAKKYSNTRWKDAV